MRGPIRTFCILVVAGIDVAQAQPHDTPTSAKAVYWNMYEWEIGDRKPAFLECADEQHYRDVATRYQDHVPGLDPLWTLDDLDLQLKRGNALNLYCGHGNPSGFGVITFEFSADGLAEAVWWHDWHIENDGWENDEIYVSSSGTESAWHIGIRPAGIIRRFENGNSIVHHTSCYGFNYAYAWDAHDVYGYDDGVDVGTATEDAGLLWSSLNGERGRDYRNTGQAHMGVTALRHLGQGDLVLSPSVETCGPSENTSIGGDAVSGEFTFDCRMDTLGTAWWAVYGEGGVVVRNQCWASETRITFEICSTETLITPSYYTASGSVQSKGGLKFLDGNQDPYGKRAEGPNRDAHRIRVVPTDEDDNIAARYAGMWGFRGSESDTVEWVAEVEKGTVRYEVVGVSPGREAVLSSVPARGGVHRRAGYSVTVPTGWDSFRIVEVSGDGVRTRSRTWPFVSSPPAWRRVLEADVLNLSEPRASGSCSRDVRGTPEEVYDVYFFGPDSLLEEVGPAVAYYEGLGLTVDLRPTFGPDY